MPLRRALTIRRLASSSADACLNGPDCCTPPHKYSLACACPPDALQAAGLARERSLDHVDKPLRVAQEGPWVETGAGIGCRRARPTGSHTSASSPSPPSSSQLSCVSWLSAPRFFRSGSAIPSSRRGERGREEGTGNRGVANRGVAEKCCSSPPTFRLYKGCQSVATSVAAQHGQWNVEKASATGGQDAQDGETRCLSVCTAVDVDVQ